MISFDHFFQSLKQYFLGLQQAAEPSRTSTGCAISPQELDGLIIVLKLVALIVDLVSMCLSCDCISGNFCCHKIYCQMSMQTGLTICNIFLLININY